MKKIITAALVMAMSLSAIIPAFAASSQAEHTADILYKNGIFSGKGTDTEGKPVFDLDAGATRQEAVTLLVTLLGKTKEAKETAVNIPFTDVADWAKPYVSYAYNNGLSSGLSATSFGADEAISKDQFITMVLCALGYEANVDFVWYQSQYLAKEIGLIDAVKDETFLRDDIVLISHRALYTKMKGGEKNLAESLGLQLNEEYETSDEIIAAIKARYGFDIEFEKPVKSEETKFFILDTFYKYCSLTVPDPIMRDLAAYRPTLLFTLGGEVSLGSRIAKIPVATYEFRYSREKSRTVEFITDAVPRLIGDFIAEKYWRDIPDDIGEKEFDMLISELVLRYDIKFEDDVMEIGTNHAHRAIDGYKEGASSKGIIRVQRKLEYVYEYLCEKYDLDKDESHMIDPYGYRKYR